MKGPLAFCMGAALLIGGMLLTGCESTGGGSSSSTAVYYGTGFYDPWYYGEVHYDGDIVVTPPDRDFGARPSHPIANPPSSVGARPTPMPSIPSTPRAAPRGGRR